MLSWTDEAVLSRMQRGWDGGLREGTPCGGGSLYRNLENVRVWLPEVMRRHWMRSVCDAGAGDLRLKSAFEGFDYQAFDLVPRSPEVTALDITKERLPDCDVILCRAVLIHLDPERIMKALELFREAAPRLLATSDRSENAFDPGRQFNPLDLSKPPYNLRLIESTPDLEGPYSRLSLYAYP